MTEWELYRTAYVQSQGYRLPPRRPTGDPRNRRRGRVLNAIHQDFKRFWRRLEALRGPREDTP